MDQGGFDNDLLDYGLSPEDVVGLAPGDLGSEDGSEGTAGRDHAMAEGSAWGPGLAEELGIDLADLMNSDSERVIPITQKLDAVQFYQEAKQNEVAEYQELMNEYSKVHMVDTSWKLASAMTEGTGDYALNAVMSMIVDKKSLNLDIETPQERNKAAFLLAIQVIFLSKSSPEDMQAAKELQEMFECEGNSEALFEKMMDHPNIFKVYNKWAKALNGVKQLHSAGQTVINTRQFREMQAVETRLFAEQRMFDAAAKDLQHVTYPAFVDTISGPKGVNHTYVCGMCRESNAVDLPFYSVVLLDSGMTRNYKESGVPPKRLSNLGVSYRGHQCEHCGAYNVIPRAFAIKLKEEVLEKIRMGSLNSKSRDPFTLGRAHVSQAVIQKINDDIRTEDPDMAGLLPEYATGVEDVESDFIELGDVLPELAHHRDKYWKILRGAFKTDKFSQDQQLRSYGYLYWLADKYPSREFSVDRGQIVSYLIKYVLKTPELMEISKAYSEAAYVAYTAEKLCNVIEGLFTGIYGEELVSTGFIKEGLSALEDVGQVYNGPEWEMGLSISGNVKSTPGLEELKKWVKKCEDDTKRELRKIKDRLTSYISANPLRGPVRYDTMPVTPGDQVSGWVLQKLADASYERLVVDTVASMITHDWSCGIFLKGFGSEAAFATDADKALKKLAKAARKVLQEVGSDLPIDSAELARVKKLSSSIGDAEISEQEIVSALLQGLGNIASNERFSSITGISVNYLKVNKDNLRLKVDSESTRILGTLFTYNSEYKSVPSVILEHGLQYAGVYLLSMNPDSANEDVINTAIKAVASEMVLFSPKELWRDTQDVYGELCATVDVE